MAIKRCTPERLRNLANNFNMAVKACAPKSDNRLLELADDFNVAIEASVLERDNLLKSLVNKMKGAIGTNASEIDNLLRNLANDIEMAIEAGAPASGNIPMNQEAMKSPDERYCDEKGDTMNIGLAGTFSLHRVFSSHLKTSNPQVGWVV